MDLKIHREQLMQELETLAAFSSEPAPVVTRVVYSDADRKARAYVKSLCVAAGLQVREDAVGNTFARWVGKDSSAPAVGTGSHIDAIPNAGKYDGTVGVLGGMEAIRTLQRSGVQPQKSIELLIFSAEEPTRFGMGCPGSRILTGTVSPEIARAWKDAEGNSLDELRKAAGFTGEVDDAVLPKGYYSHFVELHIEQGKILEQEKIPIGVVTHIAAPASAYITLVGEGGHAGGLLMPDRKDALAAAAEIVLAAESAAKATGAMDTVATVGMCEVFPGAINSVPSRVKLSLDVRDIDLVRRDGVLHAITQACETISAKRKVKINTEILNADAPAASDETILLAIESACATYSIRSRRMVARAYHDSLFMARIAPMAMIFIPCRDGVSHRPDEYASPEEIVCGVQVLAHTLAHLAG
ncbi:MAG: M20 family metallo-hydrolase [Acidobacteriaceae bacterium]